MKKSACILLSGLIAVSTATSSFANDYTSQYNVEQINSANLIESRIGGSGTYISSELISSSVAKSFGFIGYHPDFSEFKSVSGYYFGSGQKSVQFSVSVAYEWISIGTQVNKPGSGTLINTNTNKPTRPAIYGEVVKKVYREGTRKNGSNEWLSSREKVVYEVTKTEIKTLDQNGNITGP